MRFLILNTDYTAFLDQLYAEHPGLAEAPYAEQLRVRNESLFGVADFYSYNLRALGQEAWELHVNNAPLQQAWAREHGLSLDVPERLAQRGRATLQTLRRAAARTPLRAVRPLLRPLVRRLEATPGWYYTVLAAQIRHYRPDVILNQSMETVSGRFLQTLRPAFRLLIGQIAAPLPADEDFRAYDLVLSSLPNFVAHFRRLGVPAELHRFAFEPRVLERLSTGAPRYPLSFVGSLSPHHAARIQLLEYLARRFDLALFGQGIAAFPPAAPLRACHRGPAWGREMYQILRDSCITLNHHIGVAAQYANNMRLFEATGVGTLLLTDWKENLPELFVPGEEVLAYRSAEECAELIAYYLEHEAERAAIARAGQARTLREHTYAHRMQELIELVARRLAAPLRGTG